MKEIFIRNNSRMNSNFKALKNINHQVKKNTKLRYIKDKINNSSSNLIYLKMNKQIIKTYNKEIILNQTYKRIMSLVMEMKKNMEMRTTTMKIPAISLS